MYELEQDGDATGLSLLPDFSQDSYGSPGYSLLLDQSADDLPRRSYIREEFDSIRKKYRLTDLTQEGGAAGESLQSIIENPWIYSGSVC